MLNEQIKSSIEKCVLCWLATTDLALQPNVSPKEIFDHWKDDHIIIANIASPQTAKNIAINPLVSISFIDVFVQKGFQLKGQATIVNAEDDTFNDLAAPLLKMTQSKYPFNEIFKIKIQKVKRILAPKYVLFPETSEADQIRSALKTYEVDDLQS